MPLIIDYLLKFNICLIVVYLFYQILLRRLTFYNCNRWYFLGYTALSFIIPLINIMPSLEKRSLQENLVVQWIPSISIAKPQESNFFESLTYWDWLLAILLLGSLFLFARFLFRFYSLKRLKSNAKLISEAQTSIYQLDAPIAPFSFGNAIFINTDCHSEEEMQEIIRHEFVHVRQKHTIDMMWCELICIINWFNPFVWLIRHNVKQNLEFIADNQVLQNGMDRKAYQYLLLKVMGSRQFAFTNHFNFSSLKKRIAMMNSLKSAKVQLIKFVFFLPVTAVLLLSFRTEMIKRNEVVNNKIEKSTVITDPVLLAKKDIRIVTPLVKTAKKHEDKKGNERAIVSEKIVRDTVPKKENVFVSRGLLGTMDTVMSTQNKPLIVLDGVRKDSIFDLNTVNASDIQSIFILKNEGVGPEYGEDGRNGVILITTKSDKKDSSALKSPTKEKVEVQK